MTSFRLALRCALVVIAVMLAAAGCSGGGLIHAPQVAELRPHEGPPIPLPAYLSFDLRRMEIIGGGPVHTRGNLGPPDGIQLAREIIRDRIAETGLFPAVQIATGPPRAGTEAVVIRVDLDVFVTTPSFGITSFRPQAFVSATYVGATGARQLLFSNAHYESSGAMADNFFALHELVLSAWRSGGTAIGTLMANDLPRRLAASPLTQRLAGDRAPQPAPAVAGQLAAISAGTGFLLKNTNFILTNDHVVQNKATITIAFPSGEEYPGQVVYRDRSNDLALVEVRGLTATARGIVVSVAAALRIGETVHAIGYPLGSGLSRKPSMVSGSVSSTLGMDDDIGRFRTTAAINPGNSGGPVINQLGQVVGIAAAGIVRQGVEAVRFGIKASAATMILQQARATTSFDVAVTPTASAPKAPDQIFEELSPHVVLIEAR